MNKLSLYTVILCCLAAPVQGTAFAGTDTPADTPAAEPGLSHIVFDEPEAVKRYLLTVAAAEARAYAEVLDLDLPQAETQAKVLEACLRVLNATPIDALPEEHQAFIRGLREIRNDITPRMISAYLAAASKGVTEEEVAGILASLASEMDGRETALEASHPDAAAAMGRKNASLRALFISMLNPPEDPPEVQKKGAASREGQAAWNRRLAEKIEAILK